MKKRILPYVVAGALAFGSLSGCGENKNNTSYISKEGTFRGYEVSITGSDVDRSIFIAIGKRKSNGLDKGISAKDHFNHGQFSEIYLWGVPKGHPITKYANLDSLEVAYNEVKNK